MTVTITSKGQITIPLRLRERLHLKVGDQLDFDETAPVLLARRVVDRRRWKKTLTEWQAVAAGSLSGHPWLHESSATIVDDLRGGPAENPPKRKNR
jgi:AbrB family looped-hinge helix DNA binding protein